MRETLKNLKESLPALKHREAKSLLQDVETWLDQLEPLAYPCLGCSYCIPPEAMTMLTNKYPSLASSTLSSCELSLRTETWPPVEGEYTVLDRLAPVALTTLASVKLEEKLAGIKPPGLCILGKTETENIGIDKVIKNIISNPSITHFIIAGKDPEGHKSGQTLISLWENGVDQNMRVVGSAGRRPVLKNVSRADIASFRKQVHVEDMIGSENTRAIARRIRDLGKVISSAKKTSICGCQDATVCGPQAQMLPHITQPRVIQVVSAAESRIKAKTRDRNVKLDRAGYFVIIPSRKTGIILVEHYSYDNKLLRTIEGTNSRDIYFTIIENKWVTELTHAAYLGKELARAEISIRKRFKFVQDGA